MSHRFGKFLAGWLLVVSTAARLAFAQDAVDAKVALPILLRVITYDHALKDRGGNEFVVLVASDPASASDRDRVMSLVGELGLSTLQSRALRFVPVDAKDADGLASRVRGEHATAILVVGGSHSVATAAGRVAASAKIYSMSLDAGDVDQKSVLLGVGSRDGKPQIVLNVDASRAIGCAFDNAILRVARVVQ